MSRYRPDHKSFGKFMVSKQARRPVVAAAKDIAKLATGTAPRSKGDGDHMADHYDVNGDTAPVDIAPGGPRVGAEVFNEHEAAAPVEFGGKRNRAERTLGKAGDHYHTPKGMR